MSILSQQLVISDLAFTNDITTNRLSRSLTAPSGYWANNGQYPDPRTQMTGAGIVGMSNQSLTHERIRNSFTAGKLGGVPDATGLVRGEGDYDIFDEDGLIDTKMAFRPK
tara:strand:+ start:42 stop:371 length:330 start_codon:yes stop_codon:yes gene_type:complete